MSLYLCVMEKAKTIKLSSSVHKEMKTYCAANELNLQTFADDSVTAMLKSNGHKFSKPNPAVKINTETK